MAVLGAVPVFAADTYPVKPVRVIVPNPPGGGYDLVGRLISQRLSELTGAQFVVENRTGAGTLVGTEVAAKAPADGYTLLVGGMSNMAANLGLYRHLPYDPIADFVPLIVPVTYAYALVSRPDLPPRDLRQLIDYLRANPGKLSYGSAGVGTGQHIAMAMLVKLTNVDVVHIPYRGASGVYQDLMSGRLDLFFDNAGTARQYIDNGQLRAYAVSSKVRSPGLPAVPTVMETGVAPLDCDSWFGFFAPRGTPREIVEQLRRRLADAAATPEVVTRLQANGGRMLHMNVAETETYVREEATRWSRALREAGISAE